MADHSEFLRLVRESLDQDRFREEHWEGSFNAYLSLLEENPMICRTAHQRIYDMVLSYGVSEVERLKRKIVKYEFFDDPIDDGADGLFGLDEPLARLMSVFKAAAHHFGPERRVLLLHGPVGSSKSTIVRLLKKGLERYSRTDAGAMYTFDWVIDGQVVSSMMNEEPLLLVPPGPRKKILESLNDKLRASYQLKLDFELSPISRYYVSEIMKEHDGNWERVLDSVRVRRVLVSEKDRVAIGTFQPKDEKNQDSTELTGDLNYRKIAELGTDSDPRAFNFDGEFCVANRGLIEFIEVLKLDVAFLYDLLSASQEHKIKPKKFAQTDIDEVIIGHTNEPEYRRLQSNELMEAFRDRTIKIDIPYNLVLDDEIKIYEKDFNRQSVPGKHIAPHTITTAAMWAVLTRLEDPKKSNLTLMQKLKLYNGKTLPGFTLDNIREIKDEAPREGMDGISPRYIQDKISNALVGEQPSINPFMVMNELESGLDHHSLISKEEDKKRYRELLNVVREEYDDIVKNEVQRAISADEEAIGRLCGNYIDNVKAYTQKEKVKNPYTEKDEEPDERQMRSIEEKISIPDSRKDDFRREIMNYIGALAIEGKTFDYRMNERLHKALELKLFEDQKDSIKLTSLVSTVVDRDTQEKIDVVKSRLIRAFGYDEISATDVLNYVASIFARGDAKSD
ncbi:MAG: serine protein kinase [Planctomycetes bacterium]|nr:serine protein kinase [Planctomycetota bacterium]MDP6424189.1 serine protein kinase [Planctomycetota bacterium]